MPSFFAMSAREVAPTLLSKAHERTAFIIFSFVIFAGADIKPSAKTYDKLIKIKLYKLMIVSLFILLLVYLFYRCFRVYSINLKLKSMRNVLKNSKKTQKSVTKCLCLTDSAYRGIIKFK